MSPEGTIVPGELISNMVTKMILVQHSSKIAIALFWTRPVLMSANWDHRANPSFRYLLYDGNGSKYNNVQAGKIKCQNLGRKTGYQNLCWEITRASFLSFLDYSAFSRSNRINSTGYNDVGDEVCWPIGAVFDCVGHFQTLIGHRTSLIGQGPWANQYRSRDRLYVRYLQLHRCWWRMLETK